VSVRKRDESASIHVKVGFDLDLLVAGARVRLPGRSDVVELVQVKKGTFWTFWFEDGAGRPDRLTLPEAELSAIEIGDQHASPTFDADPIVFRLGLEARRTEIAFAYEMAALAVSNVRPLPHQLEAVYDEFLTQPRLRYLLADDPGAGKTIMAGLYMKELIMRRAGDRLLVVTPANLRPQWARELDERFQLSFVELTAATSNASPTQNPWDAHDRIIVSRDFLKSERGLDAFQGAELDWDLAVVDEAHGFSAYVNGRGFLNKKSQRYLAGEAVSAKAHRLVLMTATPHSGDDASFWALLRLLDPVAFGDRCPKKVTAPKKMFRKVSKENMKDMKGQKLFKPRHTRTLDYQLSPDERDLYEAVTEFVSKKLAEIRGQQHGAPSAAGFALTTMQRRLASSVRAIRRTLERRVERIERALADPAAYLAKKRAFQQAAFGDDDVEDLDEETLWRLEQDALDEWLPGTVVELEMEREALQPILVLAQEVEAKRTERKLTELLDLVNNLGLKEDRRKQLLIFTEHKDTLDYLVENLGEDFEVAVIHGGLKLADRIDQERFFREQAQIMVATEAAGEGINLQFCHLMVNYDIPWNPSRLEQRMGRIHRIGQTEDVHIFNLVAGETREGYVLKTILVKLERMEQALGDRAFDVIGGVFGEYRLRDLMERVLAGEVSKEQAAEQVGSPADDPKAIAKAKELLHDALAASSLDWEHQRDVASRAQERRLPPSYFERFFMDAIVFCGGQATKRMDEGIRVDRTPDVVVARSRAGSATRRVAPEYARLTFDKEIALRPRREEDAHLPQAELCGPGHPLFDALVAYVIERTEAEMERGSAFADPDASTPALLHHLAADVVDGNGDLVTRNLAALRQDSSGLHGASGKTLYDFVPARSPISNDVVAGAVEPGNLVDWARAHLFEDPFLAARADRERAAGITTRFLEGSFSSMLTEVDQQIMAAEEEVEVGTAGAEGRLRKAELAKASMQQRRDSRLAAAALSRNVQRGSVRLLGSAVVIPGAETSIDEPPGHQGDPKLSDADVEAIAVREARAHDEARGWHVESTEDEPVNFDLLSVRAGERRCIEVKGRAGVGPVQLTWSEHAKSIELGDEYWLYVVLDCATEHPRLYRVQDPAKALAAAMIPSLDVRYKIGPESVVEAAIGDEE
jgi:superfamily II DNA or RNA helicase